MPKDFRTQYQQLQKQLSNIGWIARGSAYSRRYTINVRGKSKCCGPYYCLTWKEENKTRTKSLSSEQFKLFSKAIANQRKLDLILSKMRRISVRFIEQSTDGVQKRIRLNLTRKSP